MPSLELMALPGTLQGTHSPPPLARQLHASFLLRNCGPYLCSPSSVTSKFIKLIHLKKFFFFFSKTGLCG